MERIEHWKPLGCKQQQTVNACVRSQNNSSNEDLYRFIWHEYPFEYSSG